MPEYSNPSVIVLKTPLQPSKSNLSNVAKFGSRIAQKQLACQQEVQIIEQRIIECQIDIVCTMMFPDEII